tara:strand:- start:1195 stop:1449 length:255 start_codon:yes stop_codon:yes gene_type:complete
MYILRWVLAFVLRLFLVVPFIILRHIFHGVSEFFASLAHGFGVAERALKQISVAPYIGAWNKQLSEMKEDKRLATLQKLKDSYE